jgi:ABC-type amino acid transport substrate-binding protein
MKTLIGAAWAIALLLPQPAGAQARFTVGYHADARPFTYENESGKPVGYATELCQKVIELAKAELRYVGAVSWVPVTAGNRLTLLREKKIQLLCGEPVTLSAGKEVSFSIPIFQGGVGALLRTAAEPALLQALSAPGQVLPPSQTLAVVGNTPTQALLTELQLAATIVPVKNYAEGVQAVLERKADVFFADRSILLDALRRNPSYADLKIVDRRLSVAPVAIALPRGRDDVRLAVDRALSKIYPTAEFRALYVNWFGEPDADTAAFFRLSALPD